MDDLITKLRKVERIVTHDDVFHADEVLAMAVVNSLKPIVQYSPEIIRTREESVVEKADMRIDIGKRYDPDNFDFDHHQKGGAGERSNGISYASAGLIWKHFGLLLAPEHDSFTYIDHKIFQPIDAEDNGKTIYEVTLKKPFTLYYILSSYNSLWKEKLKTQDSAFGEAVLMAQQILSIELLKAKHVPEYNAYIRSAIAANNGRQYLVLDRDLPIWQPTVIRTTDMKYLVHPDESGNWRSRAVPTVIDGFEPRQSFPEAWRGMFGHDLQDITGVADAEFCHTAGFMAVAKSKKGAIALTEKSLDYNNHTQ